MTFYFVGVKNAISDSFYLVLLAITFVKILLKHFFIYLLSSNNIASDMTNRRFHEFSIFLAV